MDNLIKQMRVKFSGIDEGNVGESSRVRDRKMSSQKTRSFKGDNRRSQSWNKGQLSSRELKYDDDSDYMETDEFRTAVAAAAFAINSAEEQRRRTRRRRDDSLNKAKRKHDDGPVSVSSARKPRERIQLPSSSSLSNKMKNKEDEAVPISTPTLLPKKPSELQEKVPKIASRPRANTRLREESPRGSVDDATRNQTKPLQVQNLKATLQSSTTYTPKTEVGRKRSESRPEDVKGRCWEKTEMERVKERYERLNAKILEWENEKKVKAKKKLSRKKVSSISLFS
ncbi:LOW QUALITY PROTEIN: hypothetical protein OSB04_021765 [Centaurea solstitialis]|uniref:Remorin C-terminal domain-containing protein n=1 Tax=Centaurea solstitialis TaxID=347529 RepID=A0AA38TD67_9ASTR|nr:LOW QUALITY PROTEIN: hypothetical protein OSB04_021765 [Centaurea solstitialis]